MAVLINNQPGVSLGYQFGVASENLDEIVECDTSRKAETLASSVDGDVVMREVYATEWVGTSL